ncbi:hypothetical protein CCACVL1_03528 [Corchorus capsularis]|uniref:Uncharacterized protein n=1 Tax=Corchorus capsularis TaxID=210143 RepID=A0A1R3JYN4_COCAP|nr:hypothetical protein CCACVL1_03528 [Corchorus capsularis]
MGNNSKISSEHTEKHGAPDQVGGWCGWDPFLTNWKKEQEIKPHEAIKTRENQEEEEPQQIAKRAGNRS